MPDLAIGALLQGYRVDAFLGRGGQGTVYQAEHVALGRKVALKVLPPKRERRRIPPAVTQEARVAASPTTEHPDVYTRDGDQDAVLAVRSSTARTSPR